MGVMRTKKAIMFLRNIFIIGTLLILLLLYNSVKPATNGHRIISDGYKLISDMILNVTEERNDGMKYILQWTSPKNVPFVYMGEGQSGFIERKCPYTNCIVTGNRAYLSDYTKFDVVAFAGPEIVHFNYDLPKSRSPHQKYVFASIESSDYYPTCSNKFDGYFNWTWTFRLDSEIKWGYLSIRDINHTLIGPKKEMHWIKLENMNPVSDAFKEQLETKTKAAAWFVSNCFTKSKREKVVNKLKEELIKYKWNVDIYGDCGDLKCSRDNDAECNKLLKKDYYFYLSFENSFNEDYVTEKLLHALENDVVPIVYGGANYTRFMPDGIYLNARELDIQHLAAKMDELIKNPEKYSEYFKWKNHYSYHRQHESVETEPYCLFCTILNDKETVKRTTIYQGFRNWWDPPRRC